MEGTYWTGVALIWLIGGTLWLFTVLTQAFYQAYCWIDDEPPQLGYQWFWEKCNIDSGMEFAQFIIMGGFLICYLGGLTWPVALPAFIIITLMFLLRFFFRTSKKISKTMDRLDKLEESE